MKPAQLHILTRLKIGSVYKGQVEATSAQRALAHDCPFHETYDSA
jgi:hypothetical protein